jgi:hypothetical protein
MESRAITSAGVVNAGTLGTGAAAVTSPPLISETEGNPIEKVRVPPFKTEDLMLTFNHSFCFDRIAHDHLNVTNQFFHRCCFICWRFHRLRGLEPFLRGYQISCLSRPIDPNLLCIRSWATVLCSMAFCSDLIILMPA